MGWNTEDFVLTADAQFNGLTRRIYDLKDYINNFDSFDSQYQVVVSPELSRILPTRRRHEPIDTKWDIAQIRYYDQKLIGYPIEFYQSMIQKPHYHVDYKDRYPEFARIVRSHPEKINSIFNKAFFDLHNRGIDIDQAIDKALIDEFSWLDYEMAAILAGYLKQKPRRSVFLYDIEAVAPDSNDILNNPLAFFQWMESPYRIIMQTLMNYGIEPMSVCSGKGYHIIFSVPLFNRHGSYSSAMLNLMSIGGLVQAETIDKMVTTHPEQGKTVPCPILTQRAYQGINKLMQFLTVNLLPLIREDLSARGFDPYIGITDNYTNQISIDLTGYTRQAEMGCFGSIGSVYNKKWDPLIIRIPRARGVHEYFKNDLSWMLHTRGNMSAAKDHLIHAGGWMPAAQAGVNNLIQAYNASRIKRELHEACEGLLNPALISELIDSNYSMFRGTLPHLSLHIDNAQPDFLTPGVLDHIYHEMYNAGFSIDDMRHLTYAVYCDSFKNIDIEPAYSKAEWCRWPLLLMGELFRE